MSTHDTEDSVTPEDLLREIQTPDVDPDADSVDDAVQDVLDAVDVTPDAIPWDAVRPDLDPLLLAFITLRDGDAHGDALLSDLDRTLDIEFSPGTVYPALHTLHDQDVLEQLELVQTKNYRLQDHLEARRRLEQAVDRHTVLALLFQSALQQLTPEA